MLQNVTLASLLAIAQLFGLAGVAVAQDMSTIANTTNTCINSTYKFFSPSMAAPTVIIIDRRVTFNPMTLCTTFMSNNAICVRDPAPIRLQASATGAATNPYRIWNCGGCGQIVTNSSDGLPVELLNFSVDDAEEGDEDPRPDGPANGPSADADGSTAD